MKIKYQMKTIIKYKHYTFVNNQNLIKNWSIKINNSNQIKILIMIIKKIKYWKIS